MGARCRYGYVNKVDAVKSNIGDLSKVCDRFLCSLSSHNERARLVEELPDCSKTILSTQRGRMT
jgi:hypothetical protein